MKRPSSLLLLLAGALPAGLLVGCGTDVSGPSATLLSCVFGEPQALGVGKVLQVRGSGSRSVCLSAETDADFLFIPFFATAAPGPDDPEVTLSVDIVGGGLSAPPPPAAAARAHAGEPTPAPASSNAAGPGVLAGPGSPARATDFHGWLRRHEIEELEPRIRPVAAGAVARESASGAGSGSTSETRLGVAGAGPRAVPVVGDLLELNVAISCTDEDIRTARVEHVSQRAIVVAEVGIAGELTAADYAYFGATFDTLIYPVGTQHFGLPTDIDGNERSIIFFTPAVNGLTPRNAETVVAGFFWSGDLFPETATARAEACPAANQAEMFYMRAPDPGGQHGAPVSREKIREVSVAVIGHEFQHLVNAARRLHVNDAPTFERPWLNEGLSHVAEEMLFYAVSGLEPGLNLTADALRARPGGVAAYNEYMAPNFTNYTRYLARPDTASLMGIDNLTTRGATWSFLRYAADRSGRGDGAFFHDLVNATEAGLDNLDAVLGEPALDWMQDWTVSVAADDAVPGLDPRFVQPSWNFRDIAVNREPGVVYTFPLELRPLTAGTTLTLDLLPGGAAFPIFSLGGDARAAVHVETDGGAPPASLRGSFVRIR